jgi:dihydroflavonol-4-reductase
VVVHHDDRALAGLDVERVSGDLMSVESLTAAFSGCGLVFHLAAKISIDPREDDLLGTINVKGPENVAAACLAARVERLVHFSSIHALSSQPPEREIDETREPTRPDYPVAYDRSKAAGEAAIRAAVARGLDAVIVNPTGVIGPFDYRPSPMGEVFLDLYHRRLPGIVEGGFNWVDVRDVVSSAIAAAERGRTGERYLLSGHWMSVRELAALASEITGVGAPRLVSPMWLARASAPLATAVARMVGKRPLFTSASLHALRNHRLINHAKATRELGHQPRPLRDTITDIYAWFRETGQLERRAS